MFIILEIARYIVSSNIIRVDIGSKKQTDSNE